MRKGIGANNDNACQRQQHEYAGDEDKSFFRLEATADKQMSR